MPCRCPPCLGQRSCEMTHKRLHVEEGQGQICDLHHSLACTHAHMHAHTNKQTHARMHARTRTHTYTHANTLPLFLFVLGAFSF